MLSCKEVSLLLSQACDQKLPWHTRLAVRLHLLYCSGCAQFSRQLKFLRAAASRLANLETVSQDVKLPAPARARIRSALPKG